jgi:hypothetical protein
MTDVSNDTEVIAETVKPAKRGRKPKAQAIEPKEESEEEQPVVEKKTKLTKKVPVKKATGAAATTTTTVTRTRSARSAKK